MRKCSCFLLCCLVAFVLAGCWDANEPERMVYVEGLGIDMKGGNYTVYLQIVNPSLVAKSESTGGNTQVKVVVGRASGKTLNEAIFNLYRSSQRRIFWGHLSFFVFSEEALKEGGLQATVDLFDRYRETRYTTWVYATREPLFDLLSSVPPLEMSTYFSRLSDPEAAYKQSSFIRPVDMRELLIALNEPPHEVAIPYVRLAKRTWETDEKQDQIVQMDGLALVTKEELKETLTYKKTKGLKWLNDDLKREEISLSGDFSDISILVDKIKIKKKPVIHNHQIRFQLSFEVKAVLREFVNRERLADIKKETERVLKKDVEDTYAEGLKADTDIYRLSEVLYRKDLNTWKAIEHNGKIPLTENSLQKVSVKVDLIHGDKQRKIPTL